MEIEELVSEIVNISVEVMFVFLLNFLQFNK